MPHPGLKAVYARYNTELKPLIAEYESRNENFATPLLHDLPIMFDSIALYSRDAEHRAEHLRKAGESLDCAITTLKSYLIAAMMQNVELFQSRYPERFLLTLDRGRFYARFKELEEEVRRQATTDRDKAYDNLRVMEEMINNSHPETLAKNLLIDDRITVCLKWIITVILALGVNYLILKLL